MKGAARQIMESHVHHHHHHDEGDYDSASASAGVAGKIVRDPVCGMTVDPQAGKRTAEHAGRLFHFCSANCRARFEAEPGRYLIATDPVCGMEVERASA